jgi:hypothetical protein
MANIVKKTNGAVVSIGVIFLIVTSVLGVRVISQMSEYSTEASQASTSLMALMEYADEAESVAARKKQTTIEGIIGGCLLIGGIILLSLKSMHCSECGSKVAINTAKLCGSCGEKFDGGASI